MNVIVCNTRNLHLPEKVTVLETTESLRELLSTSNATVSAVIILDPNILSTETLAVKNAPKNYLIRNKNKLLKKLHDTVIQPLEELAETIVARGGRCIIPTIIPHPEKLSLPEKVFISSATLTLDRAVHTINSKCTGELSTEIPREGGEVKGQEETRLR